jgi:pSer/pThr/pTyr-binding forkhead associated (FHA) protein
VLRSIEHRIESLFEGVFGRAFRSHVQPVELARKLAKEMDEHRTVSLSRVYVPNEYHLYLSPKDREQFAGYEQGLVSELADYLADHARREGYALSSRPRIELREDDDLSVGEFGIAARLVQHPESAAPEPQPVQVEPGGTSPYEIPAVPVPPPPIAAPPAEPEPVAQPESEPAAEPEPVAQAESPQDSEPVQESDTPVAALAAAVPAAAEPAEATPPPRGVLVSAGISHELDRPMLTLGRSRDCDIAIDDPSVSRRHAEVHREADGFALVDLGSTNGTKVNGQKIDRSSLQNGDRITLGQTELRFERVS